jgi:hypothetical protein
MDEQEYDPVYGLEESRKKIYRVSKAVFYGKDGPAKRLPIIMLSARRKGVLLSAVKADLASRTRQP